jgi:hypothetical protein
VTEIVDTVEPNLKKDKTVNKAMVIKERRVIILGLFLVTLLELVA